MYTKAQLITKITTDLPNNTTKAITEAIVREVLTWMLDREYNPNEIPITASGLTATDLQAAIEELLGLSGMTPAQIRDALEGLLGTNRLNKSAVQGGEFALNRRGKGDIMSGSYQSGMTDILKGDFWVYDTGGLGGSDSISEGDIVVAIRDGLAAFDYTVETDWWVINFGDSSLTAVQIAALLNDNITIIEMVRANRIKWDDTTTLATFINSIVTTLSGKQETLEKMRVLYEGTASNTVKVTGEIEILQMAINRVPYQGVEASSFSGSANGYDFRFVHTSGDTDIVLNPSLSMNFETNDIIDIIYYL